MFYEFRYRCHVALAYAIVTRLPNVIVATCLRACIVEPTKKDRYVVHVGNNPFTMSKAALNEALGTKNRRVIRVPLL